MKDAVNSIQNILVDQLGFPNPSSNKGVWTDPEDSFWATVLKDTTLVYHRGRVQSVVSGELGFEALCKHAFGPAYRIPPPHLFFMSEDRTPIFARRINAQYKTTSKLPSWHELASQEGGVLSPRQADLIIRHIAVGARKWLQDPRSRHMLGILPRIFTGEVAVIYELIQNAADAGASKVAFRFQEGVLICEHDGYPFTEIDVQAISEVNFSTKTPDKIGFMGVGFKSVFEVSHTPQVFSPPYSFSFDGTELSGRIIPLSKDSTEEGLAAGLTTQFRLPLISGKGKEVLTELEQFDGKLLLYLKGLLREIQTHQIKFRFPPSKGESRVAIEEVELDDKVRKIQHFLLKKRAFKPSPEAVLEFASARQQKAEDLRVGEQEVSIAIPLADDGGPLVGYKGKLQVYLPTSVHLPFGFDLQGNFLIDASRQRLSYPKGHWNREHFLNAGILTAGVFSDVAQRVAAGESFRWEGFYDLFPVWSNISATQFPYLVADSGQEKEVCARSGFDSVVGELSIAPIERTGGGPEFVTFASAFVVEEQIWDLFSPKEFISITGGFPIWKGLSESSKAALSAYSKKFTADQLLEILAKDGWVEHVLVLQQNLESKQSRRWLARLYRILKAHRQQEAWYADEGKYKKAIIFLTKGAKLKAAQSGRNEKPLRVMPLEGTSFDTEEVEKKYSLLHPTLTRELKKRDDVASEEEKETLTEANTFIDRYLTTLSPETLVTEVIEPAFADETWKRLPDRTLFRYTKFVLDAYSKLTKPPKLKLKTKSRERIYKNPEALYIGKEYGAENLEAFIADAGAAWIVSSEYIDPQSQAEDSVKWARLFLKLGAAQSPRLVIEQSVFHSDERERLQNMLGGQNIPSHRLRGRAHGDIPANSYVLLEYGLDNQVVATLEQLIEKRLPHWRSRLLAFAKMIDRSWNNGYDQYLHKRYNYIARGQHEITVVQTNSPSRLARFLTEKKWMPVNGHEFCEIPSKLTRLSEESLAVSTSDCLYADVVFESESFVDFLKVHRLPPGTTAISKLEVLVRDGAADVAQYREAYLEILQEVKSGGITKEQTQKSFKEHALIYAPGLDDKFVKAERAVLDCLKAIKHYFLALKDVYPDLEDLFCDTIGIPKENSIEHVLRFLMEYMWIKKPPLTDEFRSDLVSCYNQIVNHALSEDGLQRLTGEPLWAEFKSKLTLFCRNKEWVSRTPHVKFIYPDSSRLAGFLEKATDIAIESHLQRTKKTVAALKPLLDELGISIASEVVEESVLPEGKEVHPSSELLARDLNVLLSALVQYIQGELNDAEGYARRQLEAFVEQFLKREESWRHIEFFRANALQARIIRRDNGVLLDVQDRDSAIIVDASRVECIVTSNDIIDVYGGLAEQLVQRLGIEQLPESARDLSTQLISNNVGKLGRTNFSESIVKFMEQKSIVWNPADTSGRVSTDIANELQNTMDDEINLNLKVDRSGSAKPTVGGTGTSLPSSPLSGEPDVEETNVDDVIGSWPALSNAGIDYIHVDSENWESVHAADRKVDRGRAGTGQRRDPKRDNALNEAYGKRGEEWVRDNEARKLRLLGMDQLADKVKHISASIPTNLWDIESFEKTTPFKPIRIEVKATPDSDSFTFPISYGQLLEGAASDDFFIYRVTDVTSSTPSIHVYKLQEVLRLKQYQIQQKDVFLTLPKKKPE